MISTADFLRQLEQIRAEAASLFTDHEIENLYRQPGQGKWSAAQCLAHLMQSRDQYSSAIRRALTTATHVDHTADRADSFTFFERWFIRTMEPSDNGIRFSAPAAFRTSVMPTASELQREYMQSLAAFEQLLRSTEGYDISNIRIVSPANRFVRLRVAAACAVMLAHERRHLRQAAVASGARVFGREPASRRAGP